MHEQTIPVVDLEDFVRGDASDQKRFVKGLGDSLVEYGFVAVENHGVPREAIDATYGAIQRFFALPVDAKAAYELPGGAGARGYTGMGREHAKGRTVADIKEFWHVGPELAGDHPERESVPANLWPAEVPELREAALGLFSGLMRCGAALLRGVGRYLDADEDEFARMIDGGNTILRLIRYPGTGEVAAEPDAVWAAAHEDINLITLLVEATGPGLELLRRDGSWLPIAPIRGQLIADAGDMLQRLTNGVIPATTHRVLAPPDARAPRYSMPFFVHPRGDYPLGALPSCVTDENPLRWPPITAGEYLRERLEEIGLTAI